MSSITQGDPKLQALASHINESLSTVNLPYLQSSRYSHDQKHNNSNNTINAMHSSQMSTNQSAAFVPSIGNAMNTVSLSNAPPTYAGSSNHIAGNYPHAVHISSNIAANQGIATPPTSMDGYFKKESENIINQYNTRDVSAQFCDVPSPSKKKTILTGLYTGTAVFVLSFIILVASRPAFVMKKNTKKNGIVERKCNFLAVFIISLLCGVVVMIAAVVVATKIKEK